MNGETKSSYRQVFKSTSLVGGTQIINLAIGVVRTKVLALLLGTGGIGLAGMYTSAVALVGTVSGMGIASAGVRQVAEAAGAGDEEKIAITVRTLRRTSLLSGFVGMMSVLALSIPLSKFTFGTSDYTYGIALVSLTLLLGSVSAGQTALLQGLRRIKELAKCNVLGALLGTIASIAIVFHLREAGIALYLVAASAFTAIASWWFARKVRVKAVNLAWGGILREARALLKMGTAFMVSALLTAASAYVIRVLVVRDLGMDAVGLYTSAVTLSVLYVGIVLSAMGADFYPRLTATANQHDAMNRLVNEQIEMGVLIALPGIVGTLAFAPWVLRLFYSEAFVGATDIVRWQILGVALRVICWPMAFVQLAKGMSTVYIVTESIFHTLHVGLVFICMRLWNLEGLGIAFSLVYVAYAIGTLGVCHWISGFSFSRRAALLVLPSIATVACTLICVRLLPAWQGYAAGFVLSLAAGIGSLCALQKLTGIHVGQYLWGKLIGAPKMGANQG